VQKQKVQAFLDGSRWQLAASFTEVESGRRGDRPELAKALAYCKRHKGTKLIVADWGRAVVHTPCARQRLADGGTRLQIRFCVTDVARGKLHVLSDARASVWDCLHADGIAFGLRTSSRYDVR
jgi:hypothetical protein